jgi:hypothetical protein
MEPSAIRSTEGKVVEAKLQCKDGAFLFPTLAAEEVQATAPRYLHQQRVATSGGWPLATSGNRGFIHPACYKDGGIIYTRVAVYRLTWSSRGCAQYFHF